MAGRSDQSRDLLVALQALQAGVVDFDRLLAASRDWASSDLPRFADLLLETGLIDADTLARLEADLVAGPDVTVAYRSRNRALPADPSSPRPRFEAIRPHMRGGLGEVFLAFDAELKRNVALKELRPRGAHDPDSQARFIVEAELTGRLEHPGIVPVYSLGRHPDGRPYYAMRFIEGETLRTAIDRFHRPGAANDPDRHLAFGRLLKAVIDACNAVAYAHSRGVVHRDLKPENIMIGQFGETLVVDWGVAKATGDGPRPDTAADPQSSSTDASMTLPGALMGTPRYMSPEQAAGDHEKVGPASDIYGLGAILYHVLAGAPPFPEDDVHTVLDHVRRGIFPGPGRVRRSVDPALELICLRAMSLDPEDRHESALDLARDLEAWQADVRYRGEHERAVADANAAQARLCLERAHAGFARDRPAEGMLWLARALEHAPDDPPGLPRVLRTSLTAWHVGPKLLERSFRHGGAVHSVAFCTAGRRLATAGGDRPARVWDIATGAPLTRPLEHDGPTRSVAFHPDGDMLVTAGLDGKIRLWNGLTGSSLGPPIAVNGPIGMLSFNTDGSRIVAQEESNEWNLLEFPSGRVVIRMEPGAHPVAFAFSAGGEALAVTRHDHVRILSPLTGQELNTPLAHPSACTCVAFDPDGTRLLSGTADGYVRLWDIPRDAPLLTLPLPSAVRAVAFRPDGNAFATVCEDASTRLWDANTGRPLGEPLSMASTPLRLAFHPDGEILATGGADGRVRLWCASTGLPLGPALEVGGEVYSLTFSPDGRRLAAGALDPFARCWKVPEPVDGTAERVACWVSVTTGFEFDESSTTRPLPVPRSWDLRRRLSDLGGPPLK